MEDPQLELAVQAAAEHEAKLRPYRVCNDIGMYEAFAERSNRDEAVGKESNADLVALNLLLSNLAAAPPRAKKAASVVKVEVDAPSTAESRTSAPTAAVDELTSKHRPMSNVIATNRGLTRVRKKTAGNARVSNRAKYDRKMKILESRRMKADEIPSHGGYDGESHGITTHVRRSRRIT